MNGTSKKATGEFAVSRRTLLSGLAAVPLAHVLGRQSSGQIANSASLGDQNPNMAIRDSSPECIEGDFAKLNGLITPNERFYVRNHFPTPAIKLSDWKLRIDGEVAEELDLTYDALLAMPQQTKTVTLECAGNGRVYLMPKVDGAQWQLGAVGTAEWTGVPLSTILDRAGVKSGALEIVLQGADQGISSKPSKPANAFPFARSIPLDLAHPGDVLLAYKMNGKDLPPSHGYPLRAIVPGWYGVASVKWLSRIVVTNQPFQGYFQTVDYAYWQERNGLPVRVPVSKLQVKSQIARPALQERVSAGTTYRVIGAAWSGSSAIAKVEVSTDGKTYLPAKLLGEPIEHAWRLWEYNWTVPRERGQYMISARATDMAGDAQPLERDKNRETYMISHVVPVPVEVI